MWKRIDPEGKYLVNEKGEINGTRGILKPGETSPGRLSVCLYLPEPKMYLIHRLVAIAYLDNPEGKKEVNHKDKDTFNNHVSNLEWVTKSENEDHKHLSRGKQRLTEEDFLNLFKQFDCPAHFRKWLRDNSFTCTQDTIAAWWYKHG